MVQKGAVQHVQQNVRRFEFSIGLWYVRRHSGVDLAVCSRRHFGASASGDCYVRLRILAILHVYPSVRAQSILHMVRHFRHQFPCHVYFALDVALSLVKRNRIIAFD